MSKQVVACFLLSLVLIGTIAYIIFLNSQQNDSEQYGDLDSSSSSSSRRSLPQLSSEHHNNSLLNQLLLQYSLLYPHLTRCYSIGKSSRGKDIYALEITDYPGIHEPGEPEVRLVANIHGNEVVGREILLHFVHHLLSSYAHDANIQRLVNNTRIHVAPTLNPDGYEDSVEGDCSGVQGRTNANGIDLNRNFPDQYVNKSGSRTEIEVQNLMAWAKHHPFVLSASFHGGAMVVNYPFDNNPSEKDEFSPCPDNDYFQFISKQYANVNSID